MSGIAHLANSVFSLLDDPTTEEREQQSDRLAGSVSVNASMDQQAVVQTRTVYDAAVHSNDDMHSQNFDVRTAHFNPSRLVQLRSSEWLTTTPAYNDVLQVGLPQAFYANSAFPARGPTRYFRYIRTGYHLTVNISTAAGVAGSVVCVYLPSGLDVSLRVRQSLFNLPHVIINLATSTSGTLKIPYISHRNYVDVDSDQGGVLAVVVLGTLRAPAGVTPNATVTVFGTMVEMDLQNVRPQGPPRTLMEIAEGPGTMNISNSHITKQARSIALLGETPMVDCKTVGAGKPFQSLRTLLQTPTILTNSLTEWPTTAAPGTSLLQSNISLATFPSGNFFRNAYRLWRGSMIFSVVFISTQFNKGRVRLAFFPNQVDDFSADQANNAINVVHELGLNSTLDLVVPYSHHSWMRSTDETGDARFIGRLKLFVINRLQANVNAPNSIQFYITVRFGSDVEFVAPIDRGVVHQGDDDKLEVSDSSVTEVGEQAAAAAGVSTLENVGGDPKAETPAPKMVNSKIVHVKPVRVDHLSLKAIFGRAFHVGAINYDTNLQFFALPAPSVGHGVLSRLFAYFTGSFNIHLRNRSSGTVAVGHSYDDLVGLTENGLFSLGAVVIPPDSNYSLEVPFYSTTPLRFVSNALQGAGSTFGALALSGEVLHTTAAPSLLEVFISIPEPKFFFPLPYPIAVTQQGDDEPDFSFTGQVKVKTPFGKFFTDFKLETDEAIRLKSRIPRPREKIKVSDRRSTASSEQLVAQGIEPNPGPIFTCSATDLEKEITVYWWSKEFGCGEVGVSISKEGPVFYLGSDLSGPPLMEMSGKDSWIFQGEVEPEDIKDLAAKYTAVDITPDISMSVEAWIKFQTTKTDLRKMFTLAILLKITPIQQGDGSGFIMDFLSGPFQKLFNASDITASLLKVICRAVLKGVMYSIMVAANPTIVTWSMVLSLVALDMADMKCTSKVVTGVYDAILKGNLKEIPILLLSWLYVNSGANVITSAKYKVARWATKLDLGDNDRVEQEGWLDEMKNFNVATMAAKGVEWWLKALLQIFKVIKDFFNPDPREEAAGILEDCSMVVAGIMTEADELICAAAQPGFVSTQEFREKAGESLKNLGKVKFLAVAADNGRINTAVTQLQDRVGKLTIEKKEIPKQKVFRMEPIGIWIQGAPGQGKSFFATALAAQIAKTLNIRATIYTQNGTDDYMSGYKGQTFHMIDDFLQASDEEDAKQICQMISSVPFGLNMAQLDQKGMPYTSDFVIVTTNRSDFVTKALTDPGALDRRFPWKLNIEASVEARTAGKFDVEKAVALGAPDNGKAWTITSPDDPDNRKRGIKMDKLVERICRAYVSKNSMSTVWEKAISPYISQQAGDEEIELADLNDIEADEGFSEENEIKQRLAQIKLEFTPYDDNFPFESLKAGSLPKRTLCQKTLDWVKKAVADVKVWWAKAKPVCTVLFKVACFLTSAVAIISTVKSIVSIAKAKAATPKISTPAPPTLVPGAEARAYAGATGVLPKVIRNTKPLVTQQGHPHEVTHLTKLTGYVWNGQYAVPFLGLKGKYLVTYGHVFNGNGFKGEIVYNGCVFPLLEDTRVIKTDFRTPNAPLDLAMVHIPSLSFQFKDATKHISRPIPNAEPAYLLTPTPAGGIMRPACHVTAIGDFTSSTTTGGIATFAHGVSYECQTQKGDCGSVLLQKQGSNWYITAMHVAGDRHMFGYGTELHVLFPTAEGIVTNKTPNPIPTFMPSKSSLGPSPLHGMWPVKMGPAPLHPRDERVQASIPNLLKHAASKYRVDHFDPCPNIFTMAKAEVKQRLFSVIGVLPSCDTLEEAALGPDDTNKIDLSTSAGPKYARQGIRKKDLLRYEEDGVIISDLLRQDTNTLLEAFQSKEKGVVEFGATLKDELIKDEKIAAGNSRCIEACSVDYVLAYRKIMGRIYSKIYSTSAVATGIAVGINPFLDFMPLYQALKGDVIAIDYSKYDGSLSETLMRHAVDVLAQCHENPELVRQLHEQVIISKHLVADEVWEVQGGMPSGSPCTSVLNSICNMLVVFSSLLACGAHDLGSVTIVTYGDDVLASLGDNMVDTAAVPGYISQWFGMTATSADKKSLRLEVDRREMTFLKRHFRAFPGTGYITGVLDIESMIQKIMWCRGSSNFISQWKSFTEELVFHGEQVFNMVMDHVRERLSSYRIYVPLYEEVYLDVHTRLFT